MLECGWVGLAEVFLGLHGGFYVLESDTEILQLRKYRNLTKPASSSSGRIVFGEKVGYLLGILVYVRGLCGGKS